MKVFAAWKNKFLYGSLAAIAIFVIPILVSLLVPGGIENWKIMIAAKPANLITAVLLSLTFGSFFALYVYSKSITPACCSVGNTRVGFIGGTGGALLGKCPACFSVLAFILPALGIGSALSVTVFFARWAWVIMLASILFIIFSIYRMDGFKTV